MDPESKQLIEKTFALAQENNQMLHSMRGAQKRASFMRFIYWLIIIGISVASYYWMQPYVVKLQELMKSYQSNINQFKNLGGMMPKN